LVLAVGAAKFGGNAGAAGGIGVPPGNAAVLCHQYNTVCGGIVVYNIVFGYAFAVARPVCGAGRPVALGGMCAARKNV